MARSATPEVELGVTDPPFRPGPIDMAHLARQSLGDPGLQAEILRLYADMSRIYFARIEQSTSSADLAGHLHTLKSAAAGVGAWTVRDLARVAEEELRLGAPVNPERIEDIDMAVQEAGAFIASVLAGSEQD